MGLLNLLFGRKKQYDIAQLNREMEILNDCVKLIETTTNPETFFYRYELYLDKLAILAEAETSRYINVQGDSFVKAQNKFASSNGIIKTINEFIDRMWLDTCKKAENSKTDNDKQNRYKKFYETLEPYEKYMPFPCIEHYKSLNKKAYLELTGKTSKGETSYINDTEYEAWVNSYTEHHLDFETWKSTILGGYFREDSIEKYRIYEKNMRPIWNEYYDKLKSIEQDWSKLYNSKRYTGKFADMFETACLKNIALYKKNVENGKGAR